MNDARATDFCTACDRWVPEDHGHLASIKDYTGDLGGAGRGESLSVAGPTPPVGSGVDPSVPFPVRPTALGLTVPRERTSAAPTEHEGSPSQARVPAASCSLAVATAPQLPTIERVKALLVACLTVDEAKDVRDQAVAVATYYRERADCLEIQNHAAAVRLRAERRIGEILRGMEIRPGRKNPDEPVNNPSLAEIGITYRQSSMWQRIAALAEETFEDRCAEAQENGLELTTSRVLGLARKVAERERQAPPADAPRQEPQPLGKPHKVAIDLCRRATPAWWEEFTEAVQSMAPEQSNADTAA